MVGASGAIDMLCVGNCPIDWLVEIQAPQDLVEENTVSAARAQPDNLLGDENRSNENNLLLMTSNNILVLMRESFGTVNELWNSVPERQPRSTLYTSTLFPPARGYHANIIVQYHVH
jgi:hypothetical protein